MSNNLLSLVTWQEIPLITAITSNTDNDDSPYDSNDDTMNRMFYDGPSMVDETFEDFLMDTTPVWEVTLFPHQLHL